MSYKKQKDEELLSEPDLSFNERAEDFKEEIAHLEELVSKLSENHLN